MNSTWKYKLIVAAIDFGTTHSGFAISFLTDYEQDRSRILTRRWESGDHLTTLKTPTCLLLDPDYNFDSFGYEAEDKYMQLVDSKKHKPWHFYRRFKMKLYDKEKNVPISLDSYIKDTEGRKFSALTVFSFSISYLKKEIFEMVKDKCSNIKEDDFYYVLTTPAIWSEKAKQFMRKAAEHAKIPSDHLRIALEPECAAVFAKELSDLTSATGGDKVMMPGSCYMVIDIGGGTLDITAYRVNANDKFEEIIAPDGGPWGGDNINLRFEGFLTSLVGGQAYKDFKEQHRDDVLELQRLFEKKKCTFRDKKGEMMMMRLPQSLRELHEINNHEMLADSIKQTPHVSVLVVEKDKMKLDSKIFREFFSETLTRILTKVKELLSNIPEKIDTLIFVGGFSDCTLIKQKFRDELKDMTVIIPNEAVSSIMKGAIVYGRDTSIIEQRLSRYTYGLDWNEDFDQSIHPMDKRETTDDGYMCKDVFLKLVNKNDPVSSNEPAKEIEAFKKWRHQNVIDFPFYRSEFTESPKFIDDMGCQHVGTLSISLPASIGIDDGVLLKVYFGDTELKAEAIDRRGNKYRVSFNLFETEV